MPEFHIDEDIRHAATLPARFYSDERYFQQSKETIFARSWQLICRDDEVASLKPIMLLPGYLDEPLLLSRSDGELLCLSNVCTHRGNLLVDEPCDARLIRCGYHGRRFSLAGKFLSMPEFDNVADFPSEKDDLKQVATATHSGFVFASLDPVDRFDAYVTGLFDSANGFGSAPMQLGSITNYEVAANWALYCENYLEGFHIPYVHRTLNEIVDFGTYSTATFRYSSVQTGLDSDGKVAGTYHFLFPNTMFNVYPWGISVNIVEPITPTRTRVRFIKYVSDRARLEEGAGADLHRVELEDEKVVESVQKGVRSRFYERGRYSPTREQGTHHFHRLIAEFIG